jgi:hypothetical protein
MRASRSKSRAKHSKAPVNPWRSLPRLATLFDEQTPQTFFKGSKTDLDELTLTETQLLEQTAQLLGVSLAQLVRAGTLMYAKREFFNRKQHLSQAQDQTDNSLPRAGSGIAGVADARVQAAYDAVRQANNPHPTGQARYPRQNRLPDRSQMAQNPSPLFSYRNRLLRPVSRIDSAPQAAGAMWLHKSPLQS